MYDFGPFFLLAAIALGAAWVFGGLLRDAWLRNLIVAGLALRIVGCTLRLEVIDELYRGVGDAKFYFHWGSIYARNIAELDFSFFTGSIDERWWGTQFVRSVTAFVVFFSGESIRAAFLVFAVIAYGGVLLCVAAFRNAFGAEQYRSYASWLLLWPALCFWPSSIGKEALMFLAVGLTIYGYVGTGTRTRWLPLIAGIALATAIRPHVAAPLSASIVIAELLRTGDSSGSRRWIGGLATAVIAAVTLSQGLAQLGFEDVDIEGIQEEFEYRSDQTSRGGSAISQYSGALGVPMAFVNVLFRPFIWELGGLSTLSSLEMLVFWGLVIYRRRSWLPALKGWRTNAFIRVGLPVTASLALLYGYAYGNLGIIARQRVILFPFLLVLLAMRVTQRRTSLVEVPQLFEQPPRAA